MSQAKNQSDFDPKHRIVGIVVLVALAIIFLPMLFDGQSGRSSSANASLTEIPVIGQQPRLAPPAETGPQTKLKTKTIDLVELSRSGQPAGSAEQQSASIAKSSAQKQSPPAPKPAAQSTVSNNPGALRKVSKTSGGWMLQVGTFSNMDNAARLGDKLNEEGFKVMLEEVALNQGKAMRVRIGPYEDKKAAETEQERLQKKVGLKSVLITDKEG